MGNEATFIKVTNGDIYKKLEVIEMRLEKMESSSKVTRWMSGMAITLTLMLLGFVLNHIYT